MESLNEFLHIRKTFSQYIGEAVNSHSTHISDLMLYRGKQGVLDAIVTLKGICRDLGARQVPDISVKIDGAPALFCSYKDGKFWVATKSIFNKTPKVNFTPEDCMRNHPGPLGETLKVFLRELNGVVPNDGLVYQGDCLYIEKKTRNIDGQNCYWWQPNTILYSVPVDSALGQVISKSNCGICFHTRYTWDKTDYTTLSVQDFNARKEQFKKKSTVWVSDPYMIDMTKAISLNPAQEAQLLANNREISALIGTVQWDIITDKGVAPVLQVYINSFFKGNSTGADALGKANGFHTWINNKIEMEKASAKTVGALQKVEEKYKKALGITSDGLKAFFRIHSLLEESKLIVKALIDKISVSKNFLVKSDGSLVPTGNEGYCVVRGKAQGVKIVSRSEFSMANFSGDFLKGWDH